jgi:hypothetical protein
MMYNLTLRSAFLPSTRNVGSYSLVVFFLLSPLRRGADKSLAFPIFLFGAQPKEFFLGGLKKLEQRSRKCGTQGRICRVNTFFSVP